MATKAPREVTDEKLRQLLHEIERLFRNKYTEDVVCLIYGAGGMSTKDYRLLNGTEGIEVLYCGSVLPGWLSWLGFIPSRRGVVKVDDPSKLRMAFEVLSESTLVELMLVRTQAMRSVIDSVASGKRTGDVEKAALSDGMSVVYKLNADNAASPTGMFDWLFFGEEVPSEVRQRLL